jgi:serine protease
MSLPARSISRVRRLLASALAALACLSGPASAADVDSLVVRFRDGIVADSGALPAGLQEALSARLGLAVRVDGITRDRALLLKLPAPVDLATARAALNRLRMDGGVLWAGVAPDTAPVAASGPPTNRIVVKYRDAALAADARANQPLPSSRVAALAQRGGQALAWVRGLFNGANVLQMQQRLPIGTVEAIARQIASDPDVEYAEPDYIRRAVAVPTDPCYASASVAACGGGFQWDLFDPVGGINMPAAWNLTTGSAGIFVAVIDTGILSGHPDLAGRIAPGYDMIADCAVANDDQPGPCTWFLEIPDKASRDTDPSDPGDWVTVQEDLGVSGAPPYDWFKDCGAETSSWHGTHVAGTIAAAPNNGIGVAGINWVSKVVPVRVLGKCGGYNSDIAAAIVWGAGGSVSGVPANPNPARVVSLSLGGGGICDVTSQSAITTANTLGAVVVVAAGNNNQNASSFSPGNCNGVITVAATTQFGLRARYSNYGSAVEIAAPGGNADGLQRDILSTLNSGTTTPAAYNYVQYAGTSMATPHVSGVASLMLSVNPSLTPAQVLAKMQSTARAFPATGASCNPVPQASTCNCTTALCGSGILDAGAAVAAAVGASTTLASSANPSTTGQAVTFTATVTGTAPTGSVSFSDGAIAIAGCASQALTGSGDTRTATCVTSALALGTHSIVATYGGDGNNPSTSSPPLSQVVTGPTTATTLASSANPSFPGAVVTFTATVTGVNPTGTVSFTDGAAAIATCSAVALAGSGNTRTAACTTSALAQGSHSIGAAYAGDAGNGPSTGSLTQSVNAVLPASAIVVSNPYGALSVTGATLVGNTISAFTSNVTIQLGATVPPAGAAAEIDFQGLNLGAGNTLTIRGGAAGQMVFLVNVDGKPIAIGGTLQGQAGAFPAPVLYVKNAQGIAVNAGGTMKADSLGVDALGGTWTTGQGIVNQGTIEGTTNLELVAARVNGGGDFKGDAIILRTFGNANNPVNGSFFLQNGLRLLPGHAGSGVALTLNAYGTAPQFLNLNITGNGTVWMPSAWPGGSTVPPNQQVVMPSGVRAPGVPDPTYGGGSMIVQASGALSLVNGGTGDFVFPGGIVLKAGTSIDFNGVLVDQGWTTSGLPFQGLFFEAPAIGNSKGLIQLYSNNLNWANFSTFPTSFVRSYTLVRNGNGGASFAAADATAPHLNTYSVLINAAALGQCWTCLQNTQPVNMYGP